METTDAGAAQARSLWESSPAERLVLSERLLVASNRLPYEISLREGRCELGAGIGGLVTALDPLLRRTGGTWVGWTGSLEALPERVPVGGAVAYDLRTLALSEEEVERFYLGHANRALWPLCHYFQEKCEFSRENWDSYREVNRRFARVLAAEQREGDFIWIHDYHLLLAPRMLRRRLPGAKIGLFLHVPFPPAELWRIEPHARELIDGMLGADLVGFQTAVDAAHFGEAAASLTGRAGSFGHFPISIDFERCERLARREAARARARKIRQRYPAEIIALGVDRLDYTKGILERLRAIEIMLERHPELRGAFTFVQFSVPSRAQVHTYREMRERIEQIVGRINGRFGRGGSIPIDYRYQAQSQADLAAYYLAADLALVTPLRDGMNLVAKEYVASRHDEGGLLVLSRFAGAAAELEQAVLVNPYDPEQLADEIYGAIHMPDDERRRRMQALRATVRENDVFHWRDRFVGALR